MRAIALLVCLGFCGCEWDREVTNACRRTPGCDAGVSSDGGDFELQPRLLGPGSLIGLASFSTSSAWAIVKPTDDAGVAFSLSPQDGGVQQVMLRARNPRSVFGRAGVHDFAVVDATGDVWTHSETNPSGLQVASFRGIEPALLSEYVHNDGTLQYSLWGTDGGPYVQLNSPRSGVSSTVPGGCGGRPTFYDVEVLGSDFKGGGLVALHVGEAMQCAGNDINAVGGWLEHVDNGGRRRAMMVAEPLAIGRLERTSGEPVALVGYGDGSKLIVSDVNLGATVLGFGSQRHEVPAQGARFGDFIRGSSEPTITGVTAGEVRTASDAGLSAMEGGASYAFVTRLTQPFWIKRLGPAAPGAKVLGVKVGTTALVLAWESPSGVVWTVLAEDDGRELIP